jgi:hypothetical protein
MMCGVKVKCADCMGAGLVKVYSCSYDTSAGECISYIMTQKSLAHAADCNHIPNSSFNIKRRLRILEVSRSAGLRQPGLH